MRIRYWREFGKNIVPKTVYFSSVRKLDEGIYLDGDLIVLKLEGKEIPLYIQVNLSFLDSTILRM